MFEALLRHGRTEGPGCSRIFRTVKRRADYANKTTIALKVSGWGVGVPGASGDGERGGAGGWAQKRVGGN